jgi:hypothetical protein
MIKKYLTIIMLPMFLPLAIAQKHDNIWYLGYGGGTETPYDDEWGIAIIEFKNNTITIEENQYYQTDFSLTNSIISDSLGQLITYSNGQHIYGANHQIMPNGDFIGLNDVHTGQNIPQGAITLPINEKKGYYITLSTEFESHDSDVSGLNLYENTIFIGQNSSGIVTEKRKLIINDYISGGQITAIKHANGRDWWVTIPKWNSEKYYQLLIDTSGVSSVDTLVTDNVNQDGVGMAKYAPNGTKYVRTISKYLNQPFRIDIFDFDRCTGQLSNQITKNHPQDGFGVGVEFSPDSRYLYIFRTTKVFQYDLTAPDIFATETLVAEYDGFLSNGGVNTPTSFFMSQLGPDGKIYTASTRYGKHLHHMDFPNRAGTACGLVQHGIELPVYNNSSMPNLPNFRLGAVDGTACDTLGIDNHPLARFRWNFEDTLTPLRVTFTDLSNYEPDNWQWVFGDGVVLDTTASGEVFHTFPSAGLYTVCLTASNGYSADTICYDIQVGQSVNQLEILPTELAATVWPNPTRDQFTLHISSIADWQRADMVVYDYIGRAVARTAWRGAVGQARIGNLPSGVYTAQVSVEGRFLGAVKVIKVD